MKVNKKSILMYKKCYMEKFEELGIKPIPLDNRCSKTRKKHTQTKTNWEWERDSLNVWEKTN